MHQIFPPGVLTFVSRFVTGLLDTQTDLSRLSLPTQTTPPIPLSLRETRHRIVHRHLPTLAELKRAAQESLAWLWEHYWSHLDAFQMAPSAKRYPVSQREVQERLQGLLKTYIKERKAEIKAKSKKAVAAEVAAGSYLAIDAARDVKLGVLLDLLVQAKHILPAGKRLGASMEGAYIIWTSFFIAFAKVDTSFAQALTGRMVDVLSALSKEAKHVVQDADKEGMYEWALRLETSHEWRQARKRNPNMSDHVLSACFTKPTFWTLKLADSILKTQKDASVHDVEAWSVLLDAARNERNGPGGDETLRSKYMCASDGTELDCTDVPTTSSGRTSDGVVKKLRGPQRYTGLWRPQTLGG